MATFQRLYRASFKGVNFLATGAVETSGGRKLVDHTYPGSERRFIEDLGKMRKDFVITGIIREPNYFEKRDRLISALEGSDAGILQHPFFGNFTVYAKPYTLTEDLTTIGYGTFRMTFSVADANIYPKQSNKSIISKLVDAFNSVVFSTFEGVWAVTFAENFKPMSGLLTDVADAFDEVTRKKAASADRITALGDSILTFRNSINSSIRNVSQLSTNIQTMFLNLSNLVTDPLDSFDLFKSFYGFSSTPRLANSSTATFGNQDYQDTGSIVLPLDPNNNLSQLQPITEIRKERIENVNLINQTINLIALGYTFEFATQIPYISDEQLEEVDDLLNDQYDLIIDDLGEVIQDTNDSMLITEALDNVRDEYRKFAESEIVTVDKIITLPITEVQEQAITLISQRYYGNTTNYDSLINLNNIINPAKTSGTLKVLSD